MRHRMVTGTGLGNPEPPLLDNEGDLDPKFAEAVLEQYFSKYEGFDFGFEKDRVTVGIEPSYQYEHLKLLSIAKDKNKSYFKVGTALGPYGSKVLSKIKFYEEYRRNCKFTRFVNEWHPKLFPEGISK